MAQETLGQLYARGMGVPKDNKQAAQWYQKAAVQGYVPAQVDLGQLYYFGAPGIPQDRGQAAKWISEAAAQGNAWAQNTMGVIEENGLGISKDAKQAAEWFLKAAKQGYAKGESNLGRLYADGTGVNQSWPEAHAWLSLSAAAGEVTARKLLLSYQAHFTPDIIAEGKRLADEHSRDIQNNSGSTDSRRSE